MTFFSLPQHTLNTVIKPLPYKREAIYKVLRLYQYGIVEQQKKIEEKLNVEENVNVFVKSFVYDGGTKVEESL